MPLEKFTRSKGPPPIPDMEVKKTAYEFQKEFFGEIPINPEVGRLGDLGTPIVESKPYHEISKIYLEFAEKIKSTYL